jgi:hypothetical protein
MNECVQRAIILVGNVHALFISLCAAIAPLSFQDPLLIPKGQKDEPAAGTVQYNIVYLYDQYFLVKVKI